MRTLIKNAALVLPDSVCNQWDLLIDGPIIAGIGKNLPNSEADTVVDFGGDIAIPGLIDTHIHGAGGYDTMDGTEEALTTIGQALLAEGTTAFLATTMSSSTADLHTAIGNVARMIQIGTTAPVPAAKVLGVHLEGPFLSASHKGAQAAEHIPKPAPGTDAGLFAELIATYPDVIKIATFAPERPDSLRLAALCATNGIISSAGHTGADYEMMTKAAAIGIRRLTHAFNAMAGIHHRQPGPLTAALLDNTIELELIADGVHIHPSVLELSFRLKPLDKITLISDGTRAVGMKEGQYELGGQTIFVQNGMSRLVSGVIAGSAVPLLAGVRTVVETLGRPLYEAVRCASLNPARALGVADRLGSLAAGKEATLVRLSSLLTVKEVWLQGISVVERS